MREEKVAIVTGGASGIVNLLAIHETYHLGQASYLRSLLGKKGLIR